MILFIFLMYIVNILHSIYVKFLVSTLIVSGRKRYSFHVVGTMMQAYPNTFNRPLKNIFHETNEYDIHNHLYTLAIILEHF